MRKFLILAVLLISFYPSFAGAYYFSDDFNRPDGAIGNGWDEQSAGAGCSQGISSNSYFNRGNNDCGVLISRTDITQTSGISATVRFFGPSLSNRFNNFISVLGNGYGPGAAITGYGVSCSGASNLCAIQDNSTDIAGPTPFTFNNTDTFAMEMDVWPAPKNWMDVYVWDYTTGSKPLTPTLSFHNGGADYTPVSNGNSYVWDTRSNTIGGTDTAYLYLYEVDPFTPPDTTAPNITSVVISSSNASTTQAQAGDTVSLSFSADEAVQTPTVTIGGHVATVATTTGNSFQASTTMQAGDATGTIPFSISITDTSGNAGFTTSTTTDSSFVEFYVPIVTTTPDTTPSSNPGSSGGGVIAGPLSVGYQEAVPNVPNTSFKPPEPAPVSETTIVAPDEPREVSISNVPAPVASLTAGDTVGDKKSSVASTSPETQVASVAETNTSLPPWLGYVFVSIFSGLVGAGLMKFNWKLFAN